MLWLLEWTSDPPACDRRYISTVDIGNQIACCFIMAHHGAVIVERLRFATLGVPLVVEIVTEVRGSGEHEAILVLYLIAKEALIPWIFLQHS